MIAFKKLQKVREGEQYDAVVKRFKRSTKDEQLRMLFEPFELDPFGPIFNEHEHPPIFPDVPF